MPHIGRLDRSQVCDRCVWFVGRMAVEGGRRSWTLPSFVGAIETGHLGKADQDFTCPPPPPERLTLGISRPGKRESAECKSGRQNRLGLGMLSVIKSDSIHSVSKCQLFVLADAAPCLQPCPLFSRLLPHRVISSKAQNTFHAQHRQGPSRQTPYMKLSQNVRFVPVCAKPIVMSRWPWYRLRQAQHPAAPAVRLGPAQPAALAEPRAQWPSGRGSAEDPTAPRAGPR